MQHISQRLEILLWNLAIPVMRAIAAARQAIPLPAGLPRLGTRRLAVLLLTLACAAGFTLYRLIPTPAFPLPASEEQQAAWKPGEQRNLLVIGVDRLTADRPVLESAWLVLYTPGISNFSFIPLFPLQDSSQPDLELAIRSTFQVDREKTPGPAFLNALRSTGVWWDNYLLLDELALAELIDLSAPAALAERPTGLQLVAGSLEPGSARSSVHAQARLISAICRGAVNPAMPQDVAALLDRLSEHLNTDLRPRQITNELRWLVAPQQPAEPLQGAAIHCEFPTIQEEITFTGGQIGYP